MNERKPLEIYAWLCFLGISLLNLTSSKAQVPLDASTQIPYQFSETLPIPGRIDATNGGRYKMAIRESTQLLGVRDPSTGNLLPTTVWGYGLTDRRGNATVTYPGPTFVAKENKAVRVKWLNELPGANLSEHLLPVDLSLHMARPNSGIPVVTHLHGGHTESASDGLPEAWYTQGFAEKGAHWVKEEYYYHNNQEAATLWYHDHGLGITRLNVYAGLAGFYLLRDNNELQLTANGVLPGGQQEIEIVVQDREFQANGELYYPSDPEVDFECVQPGTPNPPGTSILPEFFGQFILVNGKTWPYLDTDRRKYRLRMLNGSDSRFYVFYFENQGNGSHLNFMQIGSDDGLLPSPVNKTELVLGPGERADIVVNFSQVSPNTAVILKNRGPDEPFRGFNSDGTLFGGLNGNGDPLPNLEEADPATSGLIMKFNVNGNAPTQDVSVNSNSILRPTIVPLTQSGATRQLALFEARDQYCRLRPQLGTLADGSLLWDEPITENPMLYDTEVWEIYNATEDAHPIHLHLVSFQIINWQKFTGEVIHLGTDPLTGGSKEKLVNVVPTPGTIRYPEPGEAGWKDTGIVPPGEVMRVIARFDRPGRYVWHCHILSHEDHEMMRPYYVGPILLPLVQGGQNQTATSIALEQNQPNPFSGNTRINFKAPATTRLKLHVFSTDGALVRTLADGAFESGEYQIDWNGSDESGNRLPDGLYFYQLQTGNGILTKRLSLFRGAP